MATAALLADVLEDVVAALDLGPAVLLGNSIGGFAAVRLAARHPERVELGEDCGDVGKWWVFAGFDRFNIAIEQGEGALVVNVERHDVD